jgi:hypothetical protein
MKNPTIEQVEFVIGRLQLVREQANKEGAFNMNENRVYSKKYGYDCGTTHCIAGWYVVANMNRQVIKNKIKNGFVDYEHGADLMAKDLGFDNVYALKYWTKDNSKIWGNEDGWFMFGNASAYDDKGFDGVIAQWQLVKQNLIELEK